MSIIGGILSSIGSVIYIRSILGDSTKKPAKASWIIWAILDTITLAGMYVENTLNGQIITGCLAAWIISIIALKIGSSGWTKTDKFCLSGAAFGLFIWLIFNNPTAGIIISLSVMLLGSVPAFKSVWHNPLRENKLAWTLFWISSVCILLSVPNIKPETIAQPIVFLIINLGISSILYFKKN